MTTFVEHRMLTSFRLYFVDIVNHDARHVMVCDGCGATFVTDELKGRAPEVTQEGTVAGAVGSAFKATRGALTDAATRTRDAFESGKVDAALSQTRDAAGRLLGDLFGGRGKKRR